MNAVHPIPTIKTLAGVDFCAEDMIEVGVQERIEPNSTQPMRYLSVRSVISDCRKCPPDSLFLAIKNLTFTGFHSGRQIRCFHSIYGIIKFGE